MSLAERIVRAKGGDWHGSSGNMPLPGHSAKDRGLSVTDNATGDDVVVHAHNDPAFNWRAWKDGLRSEGLLPGRAEPAAPRAPIAYTYRDASAAAAFRMVRRFKPKAFHCEHSDGAGGWRKGMNGTQPLPYRLPEILAAHPDTTVYIVEGEKDADNLAALGLVATTNPNGAGKWSDSFAAYLSGRACVIVPDNDEPGRAHAADVTRKLTGAGVNCVTLELPGLPDKGDVSDWLANGGTVANLVELTAAAWEHLSDTTSSSRLLTLIDPAAWHDVETPRREWDWDGFVPARQMTLLGGKGSSGKSLLGQLKATCSALGLPCLGVPTRQTVSIYLTCEDDADELHRRQKSICEGLGVSLEDLRGKLHLVSLAGAIGNELATFDPSGRMSATPAWESLRATVLAVKAGFVVLDNVAHLFAGNEIVRHHVAGFCGLLNGLAADADAALLLIGHPAKDKDSRYSGSTAWENQVRSRLFLETAADDDGNSIDPDARTLTLDKANYARNGAALSFRWHRWSFVLDSELPANDRAEIEATMRANAENTAFLKCLAKATEEKRATSASRSASNYAPRLFADMPTGKGTGHKGFEAALQRLLHLGKIINGAKVYQRDNRSWVTGLALAPTLAPTPAPTLHEPCTDPQSDPR